MLSSTQAGRNCRNRIVEWLCTAMLLNFAFTCLIWPDTIPKGSFRYFEEIGVTAVVLTVFCMIVGFMRVVALIFNGLGLPWSAVIRAIGAMLGSIVFALMAWMLLYLTNDTENVSLGVGTHALLALVECYSCMRAGADVNEMRYKKSSSGGSSVLGSTIVAVNLNGHGEQSDKERSGRTGSFPHLAIRGSDDTRDHHEHWQLSLFEGDEARKRN